MTQSDTLILKCNIEALEASALEDENEIDPFDTTEYEGIVKELNAKNEDPFDTSHLKLQPSKTELKLLEEELISENKKPEEAEVVKDPFDTEFVKEVVPKEPEPEDPFDTGEPEPGEEEEDFDPFDTSAVEKVIPSQKSVVSVEDDDFDPTRAFSKGPTSPPQPEPKPPVEDDPFASRPGTGPGRPPPPPPKVRPEHQVRLAGRTRPKTLAQIEAEKRLAEEQAISDDDFDPRAEDKEETPEKSPEVLTPESPDPFNTDGVDPFDTSSAVF